ncbi:hypothetical protein B0H13DRAFT_1866749 [Mycena leptocephala]|nr:hypothetical protein B0H13DRAFT_1866749 [Mycena leptocephala]
MGKFLNLILLSIGAKRVLEAIEENVKNAGLSSKVKVIVSPARASMQGIHPETPFDLVFIDADKQNNTDYFIEAKRLVRKGGIIIVDNAQKRTSCRSNQQQSQRRRGRRRDKSDHDSYGGEKEFDGFLYAFLKDPLGGDTIIVLLLRGSDRDL